MGVCKASAPPARCAAAAAATDHRAAAAPAAHSTRVNLIATSSFVSLFRASTTKPKLPLLMWRIVWLRRRAGGCGRSGGEDVPLNSRVIQDVLLARVVGEGVLLATHRASFR